MNKIFVEELRMRLDSYFRIVIRNIRDSIPKIIGNFLVRAIQNKLQISLLKSLNSMQTVIDRVLFEVFFIWFNKMQYFNSHHK